MLKFQSVFDTLWNDPEFSFRGDKTLIAMIIASLQYEQYEVGANMIAYGVVSKKMVLVQEGLVEMFYKNSTMPLLLYEDGSYFGEISYLFDVKNLYRFKLANSENKKQKVFSLLEKNLTQIFESFPEFKNLIKIRALRR